MPQQVIYNINDRVILFKTWNGRPYVGTVIRSLLGSVDECGYIVVVDGRCTHVITNSYMMRVYNELKYQTLLTRYHDIKLMKKELKRIVDEYVGPMRE